MKRIHSVKNWTFIFVLSMAILATACTKSNGGDTPAANTSFLPSTPGNTWTYKLENAVSGGNFNFTLKATNTEILGGSFLFKVFTNSVGGDEYYRQDGTNYYQFGSFEGVSDNVEILYLQAGATVGSSWTTKVPITVLGLPVQITATMTLEEKNTTRTVNGTVYSKVSKVKLALTPITGVTIAAQNINYWYAEGIGRIESQIVLNVPLADINVNNTTTITGYTIQP